MVELKGKTAVVTGGASGIGLAMARRFGTEGMRVVLADIDARALQDSAESLRDVAEVEAVQTDVAQAASVEALAARALERFGAVHVVCNNAGVGSPPGPVWERTLDDWNWVLNVNLWGVIHGIRTFVPILLRQQEQGHIVNTASIAGLITPGNLAVYNVTKHAVVALTESLAVDLGPDSPIGVSVLCPAFVRTRIMESERNRPAEFAGGRGAVSRGALEWASQFAAMIDAGIDPAEVAGRVVDGIHARRLHIFTHPDYEAAVEQRMEGIRADYRAISGG